MLTVSTCLHNYNNLLFFSFCRNILLCSILQLEILAKLDPRPVLIIDCLPGTYLSKSYCSILCSFTKWSCNKLGDFVWMYLISVSFFNIYEQTFVFTTCIYDKSIFKNSRILVFLRFINMHVKIYILVWQSMQEHQLENVYCRSAFHEMSSSPR